MPHPTRRTALGLALVAPAGLSGCANMPELPIFGTLTSGWSRQGQGAVDAPDYQKVYAAMPREKHRVPAFEFANVDPAFLRADIPYAGMEAVGTIVVEPRKKLLYHVFAQGRARRYGIAVGPEARGFSGLGTVADKRVWPEWAQRVAGAASPTMGWAQLASAPAPTPGIPGGPRSPRGARGLYVAAGGRDSGFVIHGTPHPETVGTEVSSGCVGLINQDVIDLYERAPDGTRVVVLA